MAVLWSYPPAPLSPVAGTAVTAAALTAGTPVPPPIIPGGVLIPGAKLRLDADMEMTSSSATPTLTLGFYIGSVGGAIGSATVIVVSAANAVSASAAAWPIKLRYTGTIRTLSPSAGVIQGTAELLYSTSLTAWATTPLPQTAAARTVSTLNTQQNNQLDVGITLSSTTGSPSIVVSGFYAEVLG